MDDLEELEKNLRVQMEAAVKQLRNAKTAMEIAHQQMLQSTARLRYLNDRLRLLNQHYGNHKEKTVPTLKVLDGGKSIDDHR